MDAEKFWSKVEKVEGGCWMWKGRASTPGYGQVVVGGKWVSVHRFSYELENGPIPEGMSVDHLCYNKLCVNPMHLDLVSRADNVRRAKAMLEHCKRGHPFTAENTYRDPKTPRRHCRQCRKDANRAIRESRK